MEGRVSAKDQDEGPNKDPVSVNKSEVSALVLKEVSFAYPQQKPVLSELSFTLEAGEFVLIVGEAGSGKSTLLRLLKKEVAPRGVQTGRIEIFDTPIQDMSNAESATCLGYVSQHVETQIVCDSAWHELAFGCENLNLSYALMRRRVAELATFFGIEAWLHARTSELSGGQKQILALASVLAMQPRVLLLDEPTSQLDPVAEKNFAHMLFRVNRELDVSIVLATHEPGALAPYATRAMTLTHGRIENSRTLGACDSRHGMNPFVVKDRESRGLHTQNSIGHSRNTPLFSERRRKEKQAISLKSISFRYGQDEPVIFRDLNLQIEQGSIHAILGGNGAGKTSLLMVIAGILKPQRGKFINELASSQVYLPQDPKVLFASDTLVEELNEWTLGAHGYERVMRMLKRIGLVHEKDRHPYDLSGGEQQKLALAKLLLAKPKLLLLDEPSKGLDARAKCELAHTLLELKNKGVTCIMASHDLSFVFHVADVASLLFDAEIVCTETTEEFFTKNLFYQPRVDGFTRRWEKEKTW